MARKISVEIVGDASSVSKAFKQAGLAGGGMTKSLLKAGLVAGATFKAFDLLSSAIGSGIAEYSAAAKVSAQTNAVIKSTGGVANQTAKQVGELSAALMRKSGVDDEAIASGQNMLLTFTRIRNEAGKGNDIFNQATRATLDLSVAMGKDMQSSAILVGKALNDPIKGMTALNRAGIQFTEGQKKSIEAMVESGNVMGAQKLILAELTTQFGGSAAALGNTVPGQVNRLRESFNNLAGQIVTSLVPSFVKILDWTNRNWPTIERVTKQTFTTIASTIGTVVGFVRTNWNTLATVTTQTWERVRAAGERALAWYRGTLQPAIQNVIQALRAIWARFGADITRIAQTAFNTARTVIVSAMRVIQGTVEAVLAAIRGDWSQAWNSLKMVVSNVLKGVTTLVRGFVSIAFAAMKAVGTALVDGIIAGASSLGDRLGSFLKSKIQGAINGVKGFFGISSPSKVTAAQIGRPLAEGIVQGLDGGLQLLMPKAQARIKAYTDKLEAQVRAARTRLEGAMSRLNDKMLRAFDAESSGRMTPAEQAIAAINARRRNDDLQKALADAVASGDSSAIARAQEDIQLAALEDQATAERKAWDDRRAIMREALERRLDAMSSYFSKEGATVKTALDAIERLMRSYGISFADAGNYIGSAFAGSLAGAVAGAAGGAAGARGARTGGDTTVHVNVQGSVWTERDLAEAVRVQLNRTRGRNVGLAL